MARAIDILDGVVGAGVFSTQLDGKEVLYNTITKVALPLTTPNNVLAQHFFLDGQEREALLAALFRPPDHLNLHVLPTWTCTLRCGHCCVLDKLVPTDTGTLDVSGVMTFYDRYLDYYPTVNQVSCNFLGGEATLKLVNCLAIQDGLLAKVGRVTPTFRITTNGTCELDSQARRFFTRMETIIVSLDGPERFHNQQRRAFGDTKFNPYQKTVSFIKGLLDLGLRDVIHVQASLRDEFLDDREAMCEYYRMLLRMGVRLENIIYGSLFPAKHRCQESQNQAFLANRQEPHRRCVPCCKFRFMSNLVVDTTNRVYLDFQNVQDGTVVGSIYDPIQQIATNNRNLILNQMPALHDPVCQRCPAVGYCWGECVNSTLLNNNRPSQLCGQESMVAMVKEKADKGTLECPVHPYSKGIVDDRYH
jgi:radical SAM protein with 4Fe4S-binding SPASM domain